MVEDENNLVFVLIGELYISTNIIIKKNHERKEAVFALISILLMICVHDLADEVESLAAARNAALSGSEPSDSIRVSCICCSISFLLFLYGTSSSECIEMSN